MRVFKCIALLRGINVGGHNKVPMADLRAVCNAFGWKDVQTYIQSGNVLFGAAGSGTKLQNDLERSVTERFGIAVSVLVRKASDWKTYAEGNPFAEVSRTEGNLVMLALSKQPINKGAAEALEARAVAGERVTQVGDALWIHFPAGAGKSKLSPALLDRLVGSPVTMRNWRTVVALRDLL